MPKKVLLLTLLSTYLNFNKYEIGSLHFCLNTLRPNQAQRPSSWKYVKTEKVKAERSYNTKENLQVMKFVIYALFKSIRVQLIARISLFMNTNFNYAIFSQGFSSKNVCNNWQNKMKSIDFFCCFSCLI